jgi:hypothetical protein
MVQRPCTRPNPPSLLKRPLRQRLPRQQRRLQRPRQLLLPLLQNNRCDVLKATASAVAFFWGDSGLRHLQVKGIVSCLE